MAIKTLAVISILIGCWLAFSPNTSAAPSWLNAKYPWSIKPRSSQGKCGRSIPRQRVIGGTDATLGSWPWQIGLYIKAGNNSTFTCGGSLISPMWVVTAAHCIDKDTKYDIVLGDLRRNTSDGFEQKIPVSKVIVHPKWNWKYTDPDIAMVKLLRPAILNNYVQPVCLPRQDEKVKPGTRCSITGWGMISYPGKGHNVLQQAVLPVVSNKDCQKKLSSSKVTVLGHKIVDTAICGGEPNSIKSGCFGDSGGPYVCEANHQWVLQGVVSWGSPKCNALDRYTVFTRVAKFKNWIEMILNPPLSSLGV